MNCFSPFSTPKVEFSFLVWLIHYHLSIYFLSFRNAVVMVFSLILYSWVYTFLKNSFTIIVLIISEELKSHMNVQSKWTFNWPSLLRSPPKVLQSLFPALLEPYCLWTMFRWVIKKNIHCHDEIEFFSFLSLWKNV